MTDDTRAQEEVVNETPQEAMPTSEQKTVQPEPESEVVPEGVTSPQGEEGLPEGVKERTKQEFEKMQTKLREERTKNEYLQQLFKTMQPPPKKPEPEPVQQIYDPNTGLLNERYLTDIERRAKNAEERAGKAEAAIKNFEKMDLEERDNKQREETYAAFPQLDPEKKETFDQTLSDETERILLHSMVHPEKYGDKELTYKTAAQKAHDIVSKKEIESITPKEQAAFEATGTSGRRTQLSTDFDTLRYQTRKGNLEATVERLKRMQPKG